MKSPLVVALFIACVFSMTGCQAARPTDTIRASGDFMMRQGDYEGAAGEYGEIIAKYPGDWQAQYKYGQCMLELRQYAPARRAMEIAYNATNNVYAAKQKEPELALGLAEAMFQQGDESRLFAFLKQRASNLQTIESYLTLAKFALDMNDPDTARTALETAIVLDDGLTTEPYLQIAALNERLGNLDEAIRRLRQAYGINPDDRRVKQALVTLGETPGPALALPPGR
jgi:tetratricopeptide (TPR) repeat protein